jgi:hypothetical protein
MAKDRRRNGKADSDLELGIGPTQVATNLSTEPRFMRTAEIPRRLRQKPAKPFRTRPA